MPTRCADLARPGRHGKVCQGIAATSPLVARCGAAGAVTLR
jgi:hypothetical protein